MAEYVVRPVGRVESPLRRREDAPKQHGEGAPDAVVVLDPEFAQAASDIRPGDRVVLVTWLHLSDRDVLRVHPRGDEDRRTDRPAPASSARMGGSMHAT